MIRAEDVIRAGLFEHSFSHLRFFFNACRDSVRKQEHVQLRRAGGEVFFRDEGGELGSKLVVEEAFFERTLVSSRGDCAIAGGRVGVGIDERTCEGRPVGRIAGRVGVLAGDRENVGRQPAVSRRTAEKAVDDSLRR